MKVSHYSKRGMHVVLIVGALTASTLIGPQRFARADTVALWLFDEQQGLYPSSVLSDAGPNNCPLVLGRGGQIVEGKFGQALEATPQPEIELTLSDRIKGFERRPDFSDVSETSPMDWSNAHFCGLMTRGEQHLRKEVSFASPTKTALNLGNSDWTIEFWYRAMRAPSKEGVVIEIGSGPRGESKHVTTLVLDDDGKSFKLSNSPSAVRLTIPSDAQSLSPAAPQWCHLAFVYQSATGQLRHYVNGKLQQLPDRCFLKRLPEGREDYLCLGRGSDWQRPLPGQIDELRISDHTVYADNFTPPESFSKFHRPDYKRPKLLAGPPLLFAGEQAGIDPVRLGGRKHVFIDDAIVVDRENVSFDVNPPRFAERVLDDVNGHLVVFEDPEGLIRIYYKEDGSRLGVLTSRDGIHFEKPNLGPRHGKSGNIVIDEPVGMGTMFVDPNAPADSRIKYLSGYKGRGIFVYTSPDGYNFKRNSIAALPFRAASQSIAYYDEQQQKYFAFHRTDMPVTVGGKTERAFVMTETTDPMRPWPFQPMTQQEQREMGKQRRVRNRFPWYLDNGPLTPPGFGMEYPIVFASSDRLDPVGTDIYIPKNVKYAWAPDTYLAFPLMYLHYNGDGPPARRVLGERERKRGSGPLETQVAVSRDGVHWKRHPRPAYIKIGRHDGLDIHKNYIAHGMVRRGEEIWQYYQGSEDYHSTWSGEGREAVFRVVQRLDGFISADAPYSGGTLVTRPIIFEGKRLVLNIDTGATGYAQVGLLDERGKPLDGFGTDDCVYINGDHIGIAVEWTNKGTDVSALAGRTVQLVFRMRGTKLYSMQFVED